LLALRAGLVCSTRECEDLDILLYVSAGQPVIESTSNVRLGCFEFNYFGLAEQFAAAGLDPWYSEWSNVHGQ
jgi:protein XRP2